MALFTDQIARRYARPHMPKPRVGDGPWGEAITHLLNQRNLSQADLVRLVNSEDMRKRFKGRVMQPKTVSKIVRGLPTTTRVLGRIAEALEVELEEVLVAPNRRLQNEQRERLAHEIAGRVLREMEARVGPAQLDDKSVEVALQFQQLSATRRTEIQALISSSLRVEQDTKAVGKTTTDRK